MNMRTAGEKWAGLGAKTLEPPSGQVITAAGQTRCRLIVAWTRTAARDTRCSQQSRFERACANLRPCDAVGGGLTLLASPRSRPQAGLGTERHRAHTDWAGAGPGRP